jgi:ABC-type transporter Mla maintaining outer membrane lipid asymmetry permease subunit MlaE
MTGREAIYVLTAALVAAGLAHIGLRLRSARRLLRSSDGGGSRTTRRVLDLVTGLYAGILVLGVAVGLATRSAAWGVGVVVALSVLAMLGAVVAMLVVAARSGGPR